MRLQVDLKPFTDGANTRHFLLSGSTFTAKAWDERANSASVPVVKRPGRDVAFVVDLLPGLLPGQITKLETTFTVDVTLGGSTFRALTISQEFTAVPVGDNAVAQANYALLPSGWRDSSGQLQILNRNLNPLVDDSKLSSGRMILNALFLDLTKAWLHLHRENGIYTYRDELFGAIHKSKLLVLAHLAGVPLIWFVVVPDHLAGVDQLSAHVFFMPADHREAQVDDSQKNEPVDINDLLYLTNGQDRFKNDGRTLFDYLNPPVPDADLSRLDAKFRRLRNNVQIGLPAPAKGVQPPKNLIRIRHWNISAGFQRALNETKDRKPKQILMVPQGFQKTLVHAVTRHLKVATDSAIDLLVTNTAALLGGKDLVQKDKMILSGFSESGIELWESSQSNADHIKALIAIEPQNMNEVENDYSKVLGKDRIPVLIKLGVRIYLIGRHQAGGDLKGKYRPAIPDLSAIRFLPADPEHVFDYPPNPAVNDFIKYRVHRIEDPSSDPFMSAEEKKILDELSAQGINGSAAIATVFSKMANADNKKYRKLGIEQWYSHHFALTGGEELTFDPSAIYGTPVRYRTFFDTAVQEIG